MFLLTALPIPRTPQMSQPLENKCINAAYGRRTLRPCSNCSLVGPCAKWVVSYVDSHPCPNTLKLLPISTTLMQLTEGPESSNAWTPCPLPCPSLVLATFWINPDELSSPPLLRVCDAPPYSDRPSCPWGCLRCQARLLWSESHPVPLRRLWIYLLWSGAS